MDGLSTPARRDGYAAIGDYALIGDGRTSALVAKDGAIDWLCLPDADSPSVFGCLLDAERGGAWELRPDEPFEVERAYRERSNVLETTFRTGSGAVRLTDAMTLAGREIGPLREIVRRVDGLAGRVRLHWRVEPRFEYGRRPGRLERRDGRWIWTSRREALALGLFGADEGAAREGSVAGSLELDAGESVLFSLAHAHREPLVLGGRDGAESRLGLTARFWPAWAGRAEYDGLWREEVLRSALVLKLLVFSPSGAFVAAPTTSLPEAMGGGRNWDYRFTWLRDSSWALDALLQLGYLEEAHAFLWWLMHASRRTQPRLQILYRLDGGGEADEHELELAGYRGSRPVRVGNGAAGQLQLDVYGAVLEAMWLYVRHGRSLAGDIGAEVADIADHVAEIWRRPDAGLWEVRSEPRHFVHSKAMCWVALDRAVKLAERGQLPDRGDRWRREAEAIREFVETEGWDEKLGSYRRAPDLREVDAGLLTLALQGYDEAAGEGRLLATAEAVRRELAEGPLVYRYRGDDGLEGKEGAFLACSFWLANALSRLGRLDEGCDLFEQALGLANDVGLYSEELDPGTGELLGNFPQALTHLALINAAVALSERGA